MRAETDKGQSEFNMAISYLGRLNFLLSQADEAAISLNPHAWYHILQAIYRELSTEMKGTEGEDWTKKSMEINNNLSTYMRQKSRGITSMSPELNKGLHDYELFLRTTLERAGLQTKRQQDARRAMG